MKRPKQRVPDVTIDVPNERPTALVVAPSAPVASAASTSGATMSATSTGRLLTRREAAIELGISATGVRRREEDELPPIVQNGVHYHSEQQILEYKVRRTQTVHGTAGIDGSVTAAAFKHFDAGMDAADAVIIMELDAAVATELYRQWANLRGGLFIDAKSAARLQQFAADQDEPLKSGADLIAIIEGLEVEDCASCARHTPRFCFTCYGTRPRRAEQLLAVQRAAHQQQRQERLRRDLERSAAALAHRAAASRRQSAIAPKRSRESGSTTPRTSDVREVSEASVQAEPTKEDSNDNAASCGPELRTLT